MPHPRTHPRGLIRTAWLTVLGSLLAVAVLIALLAWPDGASGRGKTVIVFCAAGIKPPVDAAARQFEKEYGVRVEIRPGNSGSLVASILNAHSGDLYLPADETFLEDARKHDLIAEVIPLAHLRLVLAVRPGNPRNIRTLNDLTRPGVTFGLCHFTAAAGRLTRQRLDQADLPDGPLYAKAKVYKPTVTDLAQDIQLNLDAGFLWDATARQFGLEIVEVPALQGPPAHVSVAVLKTTCQDPATALRFARYLAAPEKGAKHFAAMHYDAAPGDRWAWQPKLVVFSGGINRIAIEQTLREFQEREGVVVSTAYNGCGIHVSTMQAGRIPDVYFACDVSFLQGRDDIRPLFHDATDISETDIVILTHKGNPKGLRTLAGLGQPGLRVGVGHEKLSTLGALTRRLLEEQGLCEKVAPNIRSQTPTADLLVTQLTAGQQSLDAVVVYRTNAALVRDQVEMIKVEHPHALAVQPIAVARQSAYPQLGARLVDAIRSAPSRQRFEKVGFRWRGGEDQPRRHEEHQEEKRN